MLEGQCDVWNGVISAAVYIALLNGKVVTVELKNDLQIRGTLVSVDQFLNIKLDQIEVVDAEKYPHLVRYYFFV